MFWTFFFYSLSVSVSPLPFLSNSFQFCPSLQSLSFCSFHFLFTISTSRCFGPSVPLYPSLPLFVLSLSFSPLSCSIVSSFSNEYLVPSIKWHRWVSLFSFPFLHCWSKLQNFFTNATSQDNEAWNYDIQHNDTRYYNKKCSHHECPILIQHQMSLCQVSLCSVMVPYYFDVYYDRCY